jgi:hypothetical protein
MRLYGAQWMTRTGASSEGPGRDPGHEPVKRLCLPPVPPQSRDRRLDETLSAPTPPSLPARSPLRFQYSSKASVISRCVKSLDLPRRRFAALIDTHLCQYVNEAYRGL